MESSINGHHIDLHYAGYERITQLQNNTIVEGFAPIIKVDGQRMRLGQETFSSIAEAKAQAKQYLSALSQSLQ